MTTKLVATEAQKQMLDGFEFGVSRLEFVQDVQGQWFVGSEVLDDPNFAVIRQFLLQLEEAPL
jgi:hypothetical protein